MTWNVSHSGPKEQVKQQVVEKVAGFHAHPEVADALGKLIDAQKGPNVTISGSGSDTSASLSLSSHT